MDLTALTTPYGSLDDATREALMAHGGPYEYATLEDNWDWYDCASGGPAWRTENVYRVKPQPREVTGVWNAGRSCFEIHVTNVNYPHLTTVKFIGVLPD